MPTSCGATDYPKNILHLSFRTYWQSDSVFRIGFRKFLDLQNSAPHTWRKPSVFRIGCNLNLIMALRINDLRQKNNAHRNMFFAHKVLFSVLFLAFLLYQVEAAPQNGNFPVFDDWDCLMPWLET